MALRFPEDSPARALVRAVWHRFAGSRRWHNRTFAAGQTIEPDGAGFTIRWAGRGEVRARGIGELPRTGEVASILASGPSVRSLARIERLFDQPVACVNGSVAVPARLGRRADYYFVSDYRFVLDSPDLFRTGAGLADALVLCPTVVFAAMLAAPDALEAAPLYLREDLRRPFKRARPSRRMLGRDPLVIADPATDLAFSLDPRRGTFSAGTVVFDALQVLYGIGYAELFMFGVDLDDGPRCHPEAAAAPLELSRDYRRWIEPGFRLVAEYLRRSGKRLVNGSPDSRLPAAIIPKADGNDLLDRLARRPPRRAGPAAA